MPWVIGIDEAGYGPNLGPLVQAAAALWMPPEDLAGWENYSHAVRRCSDAIDERLLIDDSKKVHCGKNKFAKLERTVMPFKNHACVLPGEPRRMTLRRFLSPWSCKPHEEADDANLAGEYWYDPEFLLPAEWDAIDYEIVGGYSGYVAAYGGGTFLISHHITTAAKMNQSIESTGTKATSIINGILELMKSTVEVGYGGLSESRDSPVVFVCDKLGGRNYYSTLLQSAFPTGWVVTENETPAESSYRIDKLDRQVKVIFRPRADADSMSVALASMTAKYLRELCMRQFNAFWAKHVPGIQPTAGYPVDAKRFYREIEPAMANLGIPKEAVWRMK